MRSVVLLVVGLLVGALAAVKVNNVLHMRDAYAHGVMSVMQHHLGALTHATKQGKCPTDASLVHLQRLRAMQADIVPAFADDVGNKADFRKHAQALSDAVDNALSVAPADCPALQKTISDIGRRCKSCHDTYR